MWQLFTALWAVLAALMVLTLHVDVLRGMLVHGKIRQETRFPSGLFGIILRLEMKKSGWLYFYFIGALYNLSVSVALVLIPHHPIVQHILGRLQGLTETHGAIVDIRPEVIGLILLLGIQDTRRCLESAFVTEFGKAKMHVGLFLVGVVHYVAIAPALLSTPQSRSSGESQGGSVHTGFSLGAVALFTYGSYQQHILNSMLAQQKKASGGNHIVPRGGWFDHILCPLYSAELLIYFAFALLCGLQNPMANLVFAWVVLNQSICALYGKRWYEDKFRGAWLPKWVLVPGLW